MAKVHRSVCLEEAIDSPEPIARANEPTCENHIHRCRLWSGAGNAFAVTIQDRPVAWYLTRSRGTAVLTVVAFCLRGCALLLVDHLVDHHRRDDDEHQTGDDQGDPGRIADAVPEEERSGDGVETE